MAKNVRMSDIAEAVGVSIVTVSKALSGQSGVSDQVREKIIRTAEQMGYQKRTGIVDQDGTDCSIGVLIPERFVERYASFYWGMYQEIAKRVMQKNCVTMLEIISEGKETGGEMPLLLQEPKVKGILLVGWTNHAYLEQLKKQVSVPFICMDFYEGEMDGVERSCDCVLSDGFYGAYRLTNYLYHKGHRKIGFVGTYLATNSIMDRYLGYMKSMLEHRLELRRDWVLKDRDEVTGSMDGYRTQIRLPEELPTAFVCNCDLTASYLIKALKGRDMRVPEDISVVGFDNYLNPEMSSIGITTYEVDLKGMAKAAVGLLLKKIARNDYPVGSRIVEGKLIEKESVRALIP